MTNHEDHREVYHCWYYREEAPGLQHLFKCIANSANHALWQLLDCEPTATRVSCRRADEERREAIDRVLRAGRERKAEEAPKPTREEILK